MQENKQHGPDMIFRHATSEAGPGMFADLHCHNYFELIYVVSGDLEHVIEDRKYLMRSGSLALVQPSKHHYLQILSDEPYERYNILFDPHMHGISAAELLPQGMEVVDLSGNSILSGLFPKMDFYAQTDKESFEALLKLLLNELFWNLSLFPQGPAQKETVISPLLTQALDYINSNLSTIENVDEVAQALFVSTSYLYRLFRSSLHQSPKKYIRDKRLLAAQRLLHQGVKPVVACRECGFREYTTFFRSYCAFFGHSPSEEFRIP